MCAQWIIYHTLEEEEEEEEEEEVEFGLYIIPLHLSIRILYNLQF